MKKMIFILFALLSSVLVIKAGLTDEEISFDPVRVRQMVIQASILDRPLEPGNIEFRGNRCSRNVNFDPIPNIANDIAHSNYQFYHQDVEHGIVVLPLAHRILVFAFAENQDACSAALQSVVEEQKLRGPIKLLIYVRE